MSIQVLRTLVAAIDQRAEPRPSNLDTPELNDALKPLLVTLERGHQLHLIDAADRRGMRTPLDALHRRHRSWLGNRAHFVVATLFPARVANCRLILNRSVDPSKRNAGSAPPYRILNKKKEPCRIRFK